MNAPDNIYIDPLAGVADHRGRHVDYSACDFNYATTDVKYIRFDLHEAALAERDNLRSEVERLKNAIKQQATSAKMGMEASRAVGVESRRIAEKLNAESKPEVIDSEREANAMLTEENLRLEQENDQLRARLDAAMEPVEGDVLPAIGTDVLIHLNSSDSWVKHTVVGYYVWADHGGNPHLQRVFVRVKDKDGHLNARMLCDVRRADATPFIKPPAGGENQNV